MEFTRRFIFHGNAVAIGGRIVRPVDRVIESNAASTLPVTGGRSQSHASGNSDPFVRYGAAATFAEGLFDDTKQAIEASFGRVREDALTTTTTVRAEIADLVVGDKTQLVVKRLHAALRSKSPAVSGEPSVAPLDEVAIDGVSIGTHRLVVELNVAFFQRCDTHSKLLAAVDDPGFVREFGHCLFFRTSAAGQVEVPYGRLAPGHHLIYATIVRRIRWDGEPYPKSQIDHNVVTIPDFGRIFFGEFLLTSDTRRLTMMRLQLGSPDGGMVAAAEVDTNGTWSS